MGKLLSENQLNWFQQIFFERFGVKFIFEKREDCIVLKYKESEKLIIFSNMDKEFYAFGETGLNCYEWNSEKEGMQGIISPILKAPSTKALPSTLIHFNEKGAEINYDILGLTYWMLNRLEEIHRTDLDNHERFPAINSHAYKYDYLERPIVDEWLDILQQVIQRVWPNLQLKEHNFSIHISHDVDYPSLYSFMSLKHLVKKIIYEIVRNKSIKNVLFSLYMYFLGKNKIHENDPYNSFDFLMSESEKNKLISSFYFICDRTDLKKDALYSIEDSRIHDLILKINQRGHQVGIHPSYNSYLDSYQIEKEFKKFLRVCDKLNIKQNMWGGRMHYLRWSHPFTLQVLDNIGMNYDSTLGYPEKIGFRCGTCFSYKAFDPINKKLLNIKIKPLIVMDVTVISDHYMGLGFNERGLKEILDIKQKCSRVNGEFTLLWHNSTFKDEKSYTFYSEILKS
ncbi:polysaccharide deacetylase family protein [Acinetobacter variabilis]|uniref:polysaccharide deacetylase family protein n=1 Tax=Acinetobacter variabilis TaxID=70346 RepID=UPI0021D281E1|nr:polysaccharide deacetylase family protein [Acinetobacter variabilis]MCU4311796.1 polysaccharide deacetylase family protein [Acinetobacter variabilis]